MTAGLVTGLAVVTLTESVGPMMGLPWGRWPLTIHSAGWGIFSNAAVAILVWAFTQSSKEFKHRMNFHGFLRDYAGVAPGKKSLVPLAWAITVLWFIFGIGPGAVVGNSIFGSPNDAATWIFGLPSIWVWPLLWWAIGVFMIWFLAYRMELSTVPERGIVSLQEDIGDARR